MIQPPFQLCKSVLSNKQICSGSAFFFPLVTTTGTDPRDSIQVHYEKAEALRRSGILAPPKPSTPRFSVSLLQARQGRLAQANYAASVVALEAAAATEHSPTKCSLTWPLRISN